jgi:hypothetical protein
MSDVEDALAEKEAILSNQLEEQSLQLKAMAAALALLTAENAQLKANQLLLESRVYGAPFATSVRGCLCMRVNPHVIEPNAEGN